MINNKKGFTLIEILIVVAIIAILASVVLIGLGPTQRAGRDARRISDLRSVQNGLELYYNKCGYYPGAAACANSNAITGGAVTSNASWNAMKASLTGSAIGITTVPDDPNTANHYQYGSGGAGNSSYVIGGQLEDTSNPALNGGVNGTTNGVPCATATGFYCVQL